MLTVLIGALTDFTFGGIVSGSYDILKKSIRNLYRKHVLKRMLVNGLYSAIDEIKKQHHNQQTLDALEELKKAFLKSNPKILKLLKSPEITPKMRNDLFYEHCRNVFNDLSLQGEIQDQLINKILKIGSDTLKEMLYNFSDEFQKEVITTLETTCKENKEFAASLNEIIIILQENRIKTDQLSRLLEDVNNTIINATYNPFDNNLEQTNACRKRREYDTLIILSSVEDENDQQPNKNFLEIRYLTKYKNFIPESIQSEIRCGNIKSKQLFTNLSDIKRNGKTTDVIYWAGDVFHLLDNYDLAEMVLSDQDNLKDGIITDIYDIRLLLAHIITHQNKLDPSKAMFTALLEQDLSVKQKAECLFRIGEINVFQGYFEKAIDSFHRSNKLIYDNRDTDISREDKARLNRFEADNFRKMGTAYLLMNKLDDAKKQYEISEDIYSRAGSRGKVWLLHGMAELARMNGDLDRAMKKYLLAETASHRALNINRVAHSYLGRAEVYRMKRKPVFKIYDDCFSIYRDIRSDWGMAHTYISRGLAYRVSHNEEQALNDFNAASRICVDLGLHFDQQIIDNIFNQDPKDVLHPLSFF